MPLLVERLCGGDSGFTDPSAIGLQLVETSAPIVTYPLGSITRLGSFVLGFCDSSPFTVSVV
jgi:hypothetical protein